MKLKLVNQMEDVELEKDKLRALQIDSSNQVIDSFLVKDCLVALNTAQATEKTRQSASEVCPSTNIPST